MRRRLSLRAWAAAGLVAILLFAGISTTVIVQVAARQAGNLTYYEQRTAFTQAVLTEADRWQDPAWQADVRSRAQLLGLTLMLIGPDGKVLMQSPATARHQETLTASGPAGTVIAATPAGGMTTGSPMDGAGIVTRVLLPLAWLLLLCLGLGWLLGYWVLKPLLQLRRAALRLARGDLEVALPASRVLEVQELIDSFATMTAELTAAGLHQAQVEQERRFFISAISHDLRTPLFSLRAHLDGIQHGLANTPEKLARYVAAGLQRVANMDRLIADLLAYAKVEYMPAGHALPERVELVGYVTEIAQGAGARAGERGVALVVEQAPQPCLVQADPNLLWRVFDNLLDNALRHTPPGGEVRLRWTVGEQMVGVAVEDTGPGIAPGDLAQIFSPFFQGERARSKRDGGVAGLGLAIARRVMAAHAGTITATNRPEGGARFVVTMPLVSVQS